MAQRGSEPPDQARSINTRDETPSRDRDQSAVSAERSSRVADRAEAAATRPLTSSPGLASEPFANRDNMQRAQNDAGQGGSTGSSGGPLSSDRAKRIAERAYYKAERRGFAPGNEHADWLEAERETDAEGNQAKGS